AERLELIRTWAPAHFARSSCRRFSLRNKPWKRRMRKVVFVAVSWIIAVLFVLIVLEVHANGPTFSDLVRFIILSVVLLAGITLAIYNPALRYMDRKYEKRFTPRYPLITSTVLNVPLVIFAVTIARLFFPWIEIAMLIVMFVIIGGLYGWIHASDL